MTCSQGTIDKNQDGKVNV